MSYKDGDLEIRCEITFFPLSDFFPKGTQLSGASGAISVGSDQPSMARSLIFFRPKLVGGEWLPFVIYFPLFSHEYLDHHPN